jgi:hypothetical protein
MEIKQSQDAVNPSAFRGVLLASHGMTIAILNCENRESERASRGVQDATVHGLK